MEIPKVSALCCFASLLTIGSVTSASAVDCNGFNALATTVQADLGTYVDGLGDKSISAREICGAMKRFFDDANEMLSNDYSVCTTKKKEYADWLKEMRSSYNDFKKDDFNHFNCGRY